MNITQVLYVLEVAKCHNISRAAKRLFLSQSALSQQIRRLERELGYELFTRGAHGIDLTAGGRQFCRAAQPAVDSWLQFQRQIGRADGQYRAHLRIAMGSRVYSNGLFEDIVAFFDQRPEWEVTFVTEAGQDFLAGLRNGTLDLALDRLPPERLMQDQPELACCDLIGERQCVLMSPSDPRSRRENLSFSELQGSVMMSGLENSMEDRTLRATCLQHGVSFNRVYRSDSIGTIMELVRSGKGLAIGPRSFAAYYGVSAVPLEPAFYVFLKFICLGSSAKRKEIALFRDYLRDICVQRGLLPVRSEV